MNGNYAYQHDEAMSEQPVTLVFLSVSNDDTSGSFGAVVRQNDKRWLVGERREGKTPNAMELVGAIKVLNEIYDRQGARDVELFASRYLADNYKRIPMWRMQQGLRRSNSIHYAGETESDRCSTPNAPSDGESRGRVANLELWLELEAAAKRHDSLKTSFLRSKGADRQYWHREREAARFLAKLKNASSFSWCEISNLFSRSPIDLSRIENANDNNA